MAMLAGWGMMLTAVGAAAQRNPADTVIRSGSLLTGGTSRQSENFAYTLAMQTDGNLVLYYGNVIARFNTHTQGNPGAYMYMQPDGNLVVYNSSGVALWNSHTQAFPGSTLVVQDDGNLVVYDTGGTARWNAGTFNSQTPATGGGDCWRAGTPFTCRTSWSWATRGAVFFRAIDQFSAGAPGWVTGVHAAVTAWNNAPGPQWYSFTAHSNDTYVYIQDNYPGQWDLTPYTDGITWNCPAGGPCNDTGHAFLVQWSEVHLNHAKLDYMTDLGIQHVTAHESGHAMLLAHNWDDSGSIMWPNFSYTVAPNASDTGISPGCASIGIGLNCIYGSGN